MTKAKTAHPGPQAGILNRPPEHLLIGAMAFTGTPNIAATRETVEMLREVVRRELASDLDPITLETDATAVAKETGEIGFADSWDRQHLTITVGFSSTGYDALGLPAGHADRPVDLVPAPWTQFGDTPVAPGDGDIVVHVNSDNVYVAEHVLRRIEHALAGRLSTLWSLVGSQRYGSRAGRVSVGEARALIGFHDGLANLDPVHDAAEAALVFVRPESPAYPPNPSPGQQPSAAPGKPGYGTSGAAGPSFPEFRRVPDQEPASAINGTYMFVRGSVFRAGTWDERTLQQQEQVVGRHKLSGAFLDRENDPGQRTEPPVFESNQADERVPRGSHVRRANPRQKAEDLLRRVFRRGYPMIVPAPAGPLRRGLLFVSFSRSLSTQIEFILRAWLRNPDFPAVGAGPDPLMAIDSEVFAGGYYFVPPLADVRKPWTWTIPAAEVASPN